MTINDCNIKYVFYIIRRNFIQEELVRGPEAQASITVYLFSFNGGGCRRVALFFCGRFFFSIDCNLSGGGPLDPEAQASITVYLFHSTVGGSSTEWPSFLLRKSPHQLGHSVK